MDVLSGPQYPQPDEIEQFLNLIRYVKGNYTFCHPKDKNNDNLSNFSNCKDIIDKQKELFLADEDHDITYLYHHDISNSLLKDLRREFTEKLDKLTSYQKDNRL